MPDARENLKKKIDKMIELHLLENKINRINRTKIKKTKKEETRRNRNKIKKARNKDDTRKIKEALEGFEIKRLEIQTEILKQTKKH